MHHEGTVRLMRVSTATLPVQSSGFCVRYWSWTAWCWPLSQRRCSSSYLTQKMASLWKWNTTTIKQSCICEDKPIFGMILNTEGEGSRWNGKLVAQLPNYKQSSRNTLSENVVETILIRLTISNTCRYIIMCCYAQFGCFCNTCSWFRPCFDLCDYEGYVIILI